MVTRRTRKTAIAVAIEGSYGSTPGTYTPILLTGTPDFMIDPDVVPRNLVRGHFGASEELAGTRRAVMKFQTELAGSSALGTPPEWGKLIRGCGFAETITASTRVEYLPVTDAQDSLTVKFNRDGVQYLSRGARGTGVFSLDAYGRPVVDWEFWGFDTAATEVTTPNADLSAWQRPLVITDANSGNIKIGASYGAGVISGGATFNSRGMSIDIGNQLEHMKMLGSESIDIIERTVTGKMLVELTAAEEVAWRDITNANTLDTLSFNIGPGGQTVNYFGAAVQRTKPQTQDYQGKLLIATDLRFLPTSTGNNELRIIVK